MRVDVIVAVASPAIWAAKKATQTIPIVFAPLSDPVCDGFVASLSRPGGNITGFISQEADITGKLLQLLTEIAPALQLGAIMFNPDTAPGGGSYYLPAFEAAELSRSMLN